jgi:osmotically-inducible protein OsmY
MAMFGTDWSDSSRYDLILNMGKMRREGAKRVIVEAAKLDEYQPTPATKRVFNDLALGSRVYTTLFAMPELRGSALEVRATEGHIHIAGRIEQGLEDELVRMVEIIPGVTDVTTDMNTVPPEAYIRP